MPNGLGWVYETQPTGSTLITDYATMTQVYSLDWLDWPMGEFLDNIARYPRYLISFILGIFIAFFQWISPLFKNPLTAIATVGMLLGGFAFLFFTLRAMLGLSTV